MIPPAPQILGDDLEALERAVGRALATGDESGLEILGYGEISCVVAWPSGGAVYACKRLPLFRDAETLASYEACFHAYLETLVAGGVSPVPSGLQRRQAGAEVALWCVQPRFAGDALLPRVLARASEAEALALFERVLAAIVGVVGPRVGLDGQLSNWALLDGQLRYIDVTTPLLRDDAGRERLPLGLFLASIPWALRAVVRRFMLAGILGKYYDSRGVVLDLLGNLHKERLAHRIDPLLARANRTITPEITRAEVDRYYAADAKDWALLQRLRRLDRAWQRRVRRRVYPFLLPGGIER